MAENLENVDSVDHVDISENLENLDNAREGEIIWRVPLVVNIRNLVSWILSNPKKPTLSKSLLQLIMSSLQNILQDEAEFLAAVENRELRLLSLLEQEGEGAASCGLGSSAFFWVSLFIFVALVGLICFFEAKELDPGRVRKEQNRPQPRTGESRQRAKKKRARRLLHKRERRAGLNQQRKLSRNPQIEHLELELEKSRHMAQECLEREIDRDENMLKINQKSRDCAKHSKQFYKQSRKVRKIFWWKNHWPHFYLGTIFSLVMLLYSCYRDLSQC